MVRQGVLGDLLHAEAAYIHATFSNGEWRFDGFVCTFEYAKRNGNLYPTHGLGPSHSI